MGAETTVYVKILTITEAWTTVQAVTLAEAEFKASEQPGVIQVLKATYDSPFGDGESK